MRSKNLNLPLVQVNQAGKERTIVNSLEIIDTFYGSGVVSRTTQSPPSNIVNGEKYIIPSSHTWSGSTDQLALAINNEFIYIEPKEGMTLFLLDEEILISYVNSTWTNISIAQDTDTVPISSDSPIYSFMRVEDTTSSITFSMPGNTILYQDTGDTSTSSLTVTIDGSSTRLSDTFSEYTSAEEPSNIHVRERRILNYTNRSITIAYASGTSGINMPSTIAAGEYLFFTYIPTFTLPSGGTATDADGDVRVIQF